MTKSLIEKHNLNKEVIDAIKIKINKCIVSKSVMLVYNFLIEHSLLLDECIFVKSRDPLLTRYNFYGKAICLFTSTYTNLGKTRTCHYIICNKPCAYCLSSIKCALSANCFIYPESIGEYYDR